MHNRFPIDIAPADLLASFTLLEADLEFVQADAIARFCRFRADGTWFLTGTDDNSLKNVLAAESEGSGVQEFVDRNAAGSRAARIGLRPLPAVSSSRPSRFPRQALTLPLGQGAE